MKAQIYLMMILTMISLTLSIYMCDLLNNNNQKYSPPSMGCKPTRRLYELLDTVPRLLAYNQLAYRFLGGCRILKSRSFGGCSIVGKIVGSQTWRSLRTSYVRCHSVRAEIFGHSKLNFLRVNRRRHFRYRRQSFLNYWRDLYLFVSDNINRVQSIFFG